MNRARSKACFEAAKARAEAKQVPTRNEDWVAVSKSIAENETTSQRWAPGLSIRKKPKCGFPQSNPITKHWTAEHYCALMMVFFQENLFAGACVPQLLWTGQWQ